MEWVVNSLDFLKSICGGSSKIWAGLYNGTATELALKTDTDNAKTTLANAIVSKGGTATSSMTFAQLATAIGNISTGIDLTKAKYAVMVDNSISLDTTGYSIAVAATLNVTGGTNYMVILDFKNSKYAIIRNDSSYGNNLTLYNYNGGIISIHDWYSSSRGYISWSSNSLTLRMNNGNAQYGAVVIF